jgi:hypothetical protein
MKRQQRILDELAELAAAKYKEPELQQQWMIGFLAGLLTENFQIDSRTYDLYTVKTRKLRNRTRQQ